jgi:hypothetical protein
MFAILLFLCRTKIFSSKKLCHAEWDNHRTLMTQADALFGDSRGIAMPDGVIRQKEIIFLIEERTV